MDGVSDDILYIYRVSGWWFEDRRDQGRNKVRFSRIYCLVFRNEPLL